MDFDPRSTDFFQNANAQFSKMRRLNSIWTEVYDNQIIHHVFDYETACMIFKNHSVFSSEIELFDDMLFKDASILIQDDPPKHTEIRNAVTPWVNKMMTHTRKETPTTLACALLNIQAREFDAVRLGTVVKDEIAKAIFGLNDDQTESLNQWGNYFSTGIGIEFLIFEGEEVEKQKAFVSEAHKKFDVIVDEIFFSQTPQILEYHSTVVDALGVEDARSLFKTLIFASNHTISIQVTNLLGCLGDFISEYSSKIIANICSKDFADEVLRFKGVFRGSHRILNENIVIGETELKVGDYCVVWNTSANHDDKVFRQGASFNPNMPHSSRHITFGVGIHRCVGAALSNYIIEQATDVFLKAPTHLTILSSEPYHDPWVDGYSELMMTTL